MKYQELEVIIIKKQIIRELRLVKDMEKRFLKTQDPVNMTLKLSNQRQANNHIRWATLKEILCQISLKPNQK